MPTNRLLGIRQHLSGVISRRTKGEMDWVTMAVACSG
jgi:hypothetical protein